MVKCDIHGVQMLKVGRRDYICPACNGMTMDELRDKMGNGTKNKSKGWQEEAGATGKAPRHQKVALKAKAKEALNTPMTAKKDKDVWLSIRANEMMRDTMKALIQEIKSHNIEYMSYASSSGKRLYLHLKNCPESFNKELGNWINYQPISQMKKAPNVSDYDVTDW